MLWRWIRRILGTVIVVVFLLAAGFVIANITIGGINGDFTSTPATDWLRDQLR